MECLCKMELKNHSSLGWMSAIKIVFVVTGYILIMSLKDELWHSISLQSLPVHLQIQVRFPKMHQPLIILLWMDRSVSGIVKWLWQLFLTNKR